MKIITLKLLTLFMMGFAINTSAFYKYQNMDTLDFETRINTIKSKVIDLTNIFALHHIREFNEVYSAPSGLEDTVLKYLQKQVSFEKKLIAICSMTKLPLNKYVGLLNAYFFLYKEKKMEEDLFSRCIFNEFDVDYRLARNYQNSLVRKLLNEILRNNLISEKFKLAIKKILNGQSYMDHKKMGLIKEIHVN